MFNARDFSRKDNFNPRSPRGERPTPFSLIYYSAQISIHALREESDA